ncbi:hypothetical protein H4219_002627 [Mycoemilia scoparia]|uniref:Inner centromere protein ARK-binding domain-containing protein n=1 Tax=Mycoemilia scoparia TaxID=417184 RepID=A0A9W7ZX23_9FUNG|nr:hypothetical protein H4219_002627 [Mycoemilia scoparia]
MCLYEPLYNQVEYWPCSEEEANSVLLGVNPARLINPTSSDLGTAHKCENKDMAMGTKAEKTPSKEVIEIGAKRADKERTPVPSMYWNHPKITGTPPKKVRSHTLNIIGDKAYVFGGWDNKSCYNDVYILDIDTMFWSCTPASGDIPAPCRAHTTIVVDQYLYVFGGGDASHYFNTLYILNTESMIWSKPYIGGDSPCPRRTHTCFYHDGYVYLFGGGNGHKALNDLYRATTDSVSQVTWSVVETKGTKPLPRGYHSSTLVGHQLIVFGGSDGQECFGDISILDLETMVWSHVSIDPPLTRLAHTATLVGMYLFVLCGHDGTDYSNDVLMLKLDTLRWETRKVYGKPPLARGYHACALYDGRILLHGGYNGKKVFDDLCILELSSYSYLPQGQTFKYAEMEFSQATTNTAIDTPVPTKAALRSPFLPSSPEPEGPVTADIWVGTRKRNWDSAFQLKYDELETTLRDNEAWLDLYWESIRGVRSLNESDIMVSNALKTSSARRRGRPRTHIRDVFESSYTDPVYSFPRSTSSMNEAMMATAASKGDFMGSQQFLNGNTLTEHTHPRISSPKAAPSSPSQLKKSSKYPAVLSRNNSAAAKAMEAAKRFKQVQNEHEADQVLRQIGSNDKKNAMEPISGTDKLKEDGFNADSHISGGAAVRGRPPMSMFYNFNGDTNSSPHSRKPLGISLSQESNKSHGSGGDLQRKYSQSTSRFQATSPVPNLREFILNGGLESPAKSPTKAPSTPLASLPGSHQKDTSVSRPSSQYIPDWAESFNQHSLSKPSSPSVSRSGSIASALLGKSASAKSDGKSTQGMLPVLSEQSADSEKENIDHSTPIGKSNMTPSDSSAIRYSKATEIITASQQDVESDFDGQGDVQGHDEEPSIGQEAIEVDGSEVIIESSSEVSEPESDAEEEKETADVPVPDQVGYEGSDLEAQEDAENHYSPQSEDELSEGMDVEDTKDASDQESEYATTDSEEEDIQNNIEAIEAALGPPTPMVPRAKPNPTIDENKETKSVVKPESKTSKLNKLEENTNSKLERAKPAGIRTSKAPSRPESRQGLKTSHFNKSQTSIVPGSVAATRKMFEKQKSGNLRVQPTPGPSSALRSPNLNIQPTPLNRRPPPASFVKRTPVVGSTNTNASASLTKSIAKTTASNSKMRTLNAKPSFETLSKPAPSQSGIQRPGVASATKSSNNQSHLKNGVKPTIEKSSNLFKSIQRPPSRANTQKSGIPTSNTQVVSSLTKKPSSLQISGAKPQFLKKKGSSSSISENDKATNGQAKAAKPIPIPAPSGTSMQAKTPMVSSNGSNSSIFSAVMSAIASPISWLGNGNNQSQFPTHDENRNITGISNEKGSIYKEKNDPKVTQDMATVTPKAHPKIAEAKSEKPSSPYNYTTSPAPHTPLPQHAGANSSLMMPVYEDKCVPLKVSSDSERDRRSSGSMLSSGSEIYDIVGSSAKRRLTGESAISSSFFSEEDDDQADDELINTQPGLQHVQKKSSQKSHHSSFVPSSYEPQTPMNASRASMSSYDGDNDNLFLTPSNKRVPNSGSTTRESIIHRRVSEIRDEYTSIVPPGCESPPEIESEYSSDEFTPEHPSKKKNNWPVPRWAQSPNLLQGLDNQKFTNPDRVFGHVRPIKISEIFGVRYQERTRRSTMIWTGSDELTPAEIARYNKRMGFKK